MFAAFDVRKQTLNKPWRTFLSQFRNRGRHNSGQLYNPARTHRSYRYRSGAMVFGVYSSASIPSPRPLWVSYIASVRVERLSLARYALHLRALLRVPTFAYHVVGQNGRCWEACLLSTCSIAHQACCRHFRNLVLHNGCATCTSPRERTCACSCVRSNSRFELALRRLPPWSTSCCCMFAPAMRSLWVAPRRLSAPAFVVPR